MKISISIFIVAITGLLLVGCTDKLDVQQAYDFTLTTMPVQKKIKQGETAEIRCQLNRNGMYDKAEYEIVYFQPEGKGILKMDDNTVFLPNDFYKLDREIFRLYYTSQCSDQQQIDITIRDNFGSRYDLSISFQNDSDKQEQL